MLGTIANGIGGILKDVAIGCEKAWDVLCDEVKEIPDAFTNGLDKGLITADEPNTNTNVEDDKKPFFVHPENPEK